MNEKENEPPHEVARSEGAADLLRMQGDPAFDGSARSKRPRAETVVPINGEVRKSKRIRMKGSEKGKGVDIGNVKGSLEDGELEDPVSPLQDGRSSQETLDETQF